MRVVICGAGLVGYNIARCLIEEENDVTVVDNDPELVSKINETLDCRGQLGHASSPSILEKAGIADADMLIAVTREDEVNMMACQVASTLFNVPRKLARVRGQSYLETKYSNLFSPEGCAVDIIISPEQEVAEAIVRRIKAPGAFDVVPFCKGIVSIIAVIVTENFKILNMSLDRILGEYDDIKMNVMGIMRSEKLIIPNQDTTVEIGDKVYFVCEQKMIRQCLNLFGHEEEENNRLLLIGGGHVGSCVASKLENDKDMSLRVIEMDKNVARKLAEKMPSTTIINGDALDSDILEEAGIHQSDVCVSVTNDDETNLLTSLLAKNAGVSRVISLINSRYYGLTDKLGVDVTVNPRDITASIILESIRHGNIKSLYTMPNNVAEIFEIEVSKNSSIEGVPIKNVKIPKNTQLGLVISGDDIFVPYGETILQSGDRVVLSTETKNTKTITELFTSIKEFY